MSSVNNNCIAEWFGHRVYPQVSSDPQALTDQQSKRCPFLSEATQEDQACIKAKTSLGVCTISSLSNGPRQDWLACPYRGLDGTLLFDVATRLFGPSPVQQRLIIPAPNLAKREVRNSLIASIRSGHNPLVYLQDKLGGEISISKTDRSPELSFDITLVELALVEKRIEVARYGILELQTMDFHGSYRHAVKNLEDSLRLHKNSFHETLEKNQQWLGERIEGPNIANVFKRTFYQMMLKFQIATQPTCAGTVLALPEAVWDSWQRHLGAPTLIRNQDGFELRAPDAGEFLGVAPAWIYVFDIDSDSRDSPDPVKIKMRIETNADSIAYYALKVAPDAAIGIDGSANSIPNRIRRRLSTWWPDIQELSG